MGIWGKFIWGVGRWGVGAAFPPDPAEADAEKFSSDSPPLTSADADETGDIFPIGHISDHCDRATDRLLWQFDDSDRLKAFICAFVKQLQEIEDSFWDLLFTTTIDNALGVYLDAIGALWGEGRGGLADTIYRKLIKARARASRSHSGAEDVIAVARRVFDGAETVTFAKTAAKEFYLTIGGPGVGAGFPGGKLWRIIDAARATGSQFILLTKPDGDAGTIKFQDIGTGTDLPTAIGPGNGTFAAAYGID